MQCKTLLFIFYSEKTLKCTPEATIIPYFTKPWYDKDISKLPLCRDDCKSLWVKHFDLFFSQRILNFNTCYEKCSIWKSLARNESKGRGLKCERYQSSRAKTLTNKQHNNFWLMVLTSICKYSLYVKWRNVDRSIFHADVIYGISKIFFK